MTDSEKIKNLEKHFNLSTRALAARLEIKTAQTLYDIHRGKHGISKELAQVIHEKLGASLAWLLTGSGEMLIGSEPSNSASDKNPIEEHLARMDKDLAEIKAKEGKTLLLINIYMEKIMEAFKISLDAKSKNAVDKILDDFS